MRVSNVYTLNIDKLYAAACIKQNGSFRDRNFNDNLINLYNHITVTFILEDVSAYEYILLKYYSTNISALFNKSILYKSPDYNPELFNYANLIYMISEDSDIVNTPIKYDYPYLYGPAFLVKGSCNVSFSGREIITLFDIDPSNFFIMATKGKVFVEPGKPEFNTSIDINDVSYKNIINNYLIDKFLKSFYNSYFLKATTSVDMLSDTVIHKYFSHHDNLISMESISTPVFTSNLNTGNPYKELDLVKSENYSDYKSFLNNDNIYTSTYIVFNIYSRLSTYINLLEYLPKEFFISKEDLKVPSRFREIYIPIEFNKKYGELLEDAYTKLDTYLRSETKNFYVKYQCTYLNSMYAYSIKLKLDDINLYFNRLDKKVLSSESIEIINNIIKFSKAVYKLF